MANLYTRFFHALLGLLFCFSAFCAMTTNDMVDWAESRGYGLYWFTTVASDGVEWLWGTAIDSNGMAQEWSVFVPSTQTWANGQTFSEPLTTSGAVEFANNSDYGSSGGGDDSTTDCLLDTDGNPCTPSPDETLASTSKRGKGSRQPLASMSVYGLVMRLGYLRPRHMLHSLEPMLQEQPVLLDRERALREALLSGKLEYLSESQKKSTRIQ